MPAKLSKPFKMLLAGGHDNDPTIVTLSYEPRAVRHCDTCDRVLVGTKDGRVYLLTAPLAGDMRIEVFRCDGDPPEGGIRAISGCPCKSQHWAIDRRGRLYSLTLGDGRGGPSMTCSKLKAPKNPVAFVFDPSRGTLGLSAHRTLWRIADDDVPTVKLLSHPTRWVFPDTRDRAGDLWLVGPDGHVRRLDLAGEEIDVGTFRHPPTCVTTDRGEVSPFKFRGIFYGSTAGLRLWIPPKARSGRALECALRSPPRVSFVRRLQLALGKNAPHALIVCGQAGEVLQLDWNKQDAESYMNREGKEPLAVPWRSLDDEVLNIVMLGQPKPDIAAKDRRVLFFLRSHEIVSIEMHHRDDLRDAELPQSRICALLADRDLSPRCLADEATADPAWAEAFLRCYFREAVRASVSTPESGSHANPMLLIRAGAKTLAAAVGLPRVEVLSLATFLRAHTLHFMSKVDEADSAWDDVVQWTRFIRTHFMLAHTYDAKNVGLLDLAKANDNRPSPDAFVYRARLDTRQFDVFRSWRLPAEPFTLLAQEEAFACTLGDGSVAIGDPQRPELTLRREAPAARAGQESSRQPEPQKKRYRRYSHVLARFQSDWIWLPRNRNRSHDAEDEPAPDVHAAIWIGDRLLVAQRSPKMPLAWMTVSTSGSQDGVPRTSANEPLASRPFGRPRNRVLLAIENWLILAGDEGLVRVLSKPPPGGKVKLKPLLEIRVDAPIVSGTIAAGGVPGDPPVLAIGTSSGDVMVFDLIHRGNEALYMRLSFRNQVFAPVTSMFTLRSTPDSHNTRTLGVLDRSGHLTFYQLDRPSEQATSDTANLSFRGRRLAQLRVLTQGVAASPLAAVRPDEVDSILVVGRDHDRWTCLHLRWIAADVEATHRAMRTAIRSPPCTALDEQMMIDLLRAAPHRDASVRALLGPQALSSTPPSSPDAPAAISRQVSEALAARPDDHLEFTALLRHFRNLSDSEWARGNYDQAGENLLPIIRCLGEDERAGDWRAHAPLRAALSDVIIGFALLRLAGSPHEMAPKILGWMEDVFLDEEPRVRLIALQSLARTVWAISKNSGSDLLRRRVFPSQSGQPDVTGARWLIDLCAKVVKTFPPVSNEEPRCDGVTWTALVTLANLIYLYPDCTLVILHHLAASGVDAASLSIIRGRLSHHGHRSRSGERPAMGTILQRLELYFPQLSNPPTMAEIFNHAAKIENCQIPDGPDGACLRAQKLVYQVLRKLAWASSVQQITNEENLKVRDEAGETRVIQSVTWEKELFTAKKGWFWRVRDWLENHFRPFAQELSPESRTNTPSQAVPPSTANPEAAAMPSNWLDSLERADAVMHLVEPERTIIAAICQHWKATLSEGLPAQGQQAAGWKLGTYIHLGRRENVIFDVTAPNGNSTDYVVAARAADRERVKDVVRKWELVRDASKGCPALPVHDVVHRHSQAWLIMRRIRGKPPEESRVSTPAAYKMLIARVQSLSNEIGMALRRLHEKGIWHGDIKIDNVYRQPDGQHVLLDFGRVAWIDENNERNEHIAGTPSGERFAVEKNRQKWNTECPGTGCDIAGLIEILSLLLTNKAEETIVTRVDSNLAEWRNWILKLRDGLSTATYVPPPESAFEHTSNFVQLIADAVSRAKPLKSSSSQDTMDLAAAGGIRVPTLAIIAHPRDTSYVSKLKDHLASRTQNGEISVSVPEPGEPRLPGESPTIRNADIVVMLVSVSLVSNMNDHVQWFRNSQKAIIPVLVGNVSLANHWLGKLQCLPRNGKPISDSRDRDAAWTEVVMAIMAKIVAQQNQLPTT